MSPEKQVTDGDSGAGPEVEKTPNEAQPEKSNNVEAKEKSNGPVGSEAVPRQADAPRRSEPKTEGKAKPKAREEAHPVSAPKASGPKSLAEVMKVDLRVRRRRHL